MAFVEWGDKENPRVLICVHGLTRSGRDFDVLARALAPDYRVVCPDIAGRGRSAWLADPTCYVVPQYIADCLLLIDRLGARDVHWVGTSMGGLIGMGIASLPEQRITRLVLNDIGPVLEHAAVARIAAYVGAPVRFATFEAGVDYVRTVNGTFGEHTDAEWAMLAESVLVQDADAWRYSCDPAVALPFRALAESIPVGGAVSSWPLYDAISCRTLALRGESSDLLSPAVHAEMGTRGPRAQLAVLAGCGHAPTLMHADQISVVRDFLLA